MNIDNYHFDKGAVRLYKMSIVKYGIPRIHRGIEEVLLGF
jgi:hypothetical protein